MLARIALSEKLKAAIVIASFCCVVPVVDFLLLPLPHAAATRARARTTVGKTRWARCFRMNASLLDDSGRLDGRGRSDEGVILASMAVGQASRDAEPLDESENQLGQNRQDGDEKGAG